jgi:serine/threonine protein kinase
MTTSPTRDQFLDQPTSNQFGENFRLEREIGRSQAASLYRAAEIASGRPVAVKIFRRRFSADPRFAIHFREFMKAIFGVENEHLVTILDYGMADGRYFIASEWVDGQDLGAYQAEYGPLTAIQAIAIASQVCTALDVVHRSGLLHRNLKPQNILLSSAGGVKVSDSGLSDLISETGLSRTHVMVSRFHYISPEQVRSQAVGPESDLYSLGILLYEMLTTRLPFESRDAWEVLRMHAEADPPALNPAMAKIPAPLAAVVLRALQKEPADRFRSAQEMKEALTAVFANSVPAPQAPNSSLGARSWTGWLAQAFYRLWRFLRRPVNLPLFDLKVPFWILLVIQLFASFTLAFAFFSLLIWIARGFGGIG